MNVVKRKNGGRGAMRDQDNGGMGSGVENVRMDQVPGPSRELRAKKSGDELEVKSRRKGSTRGNINMAEDSFGSALNGRKGTSDAKQLKLEVTNLGNQVRSLRSNLRAEIELKGRIAKALKKKECRIVELSGEVEGYQDKVKTLEETNSGLMGENKAIKRKADQQMVRVLTELKEKDEKRKEMGQVIEGQRMDLSFVAGELSRVKKAEAVRVRCKLEEDIEQANKEEILCRKRRKNLMNLLGEGILIRQRRKATLL